MAALSSPVSTVADPDDPIERIRRFNRFYTRRLGVLDEGLLQSRFTLTESRLLWELAHGDSPTMTELRRTLALDGGYLSRLLTGLKERGLVSSAPAPQDARRQLLQLSAAGRRAFAPLQTRSREQVGAMLGALNADQQQRLLDALATITQLLDDEAPAPRPAAPAPWLLRPHRPGDIGWMTARHGALYAQEYGWDQRFEALVARLGADFIDRFDARREACWIAERAGSNLGCVFLVQARDEASAKPIRGVAQLRMLLVEPSARGAGIGERLVDECSRFAQQAGYRTIRLWTNSVLTGARRLYQKAGYVMTASEPHHSFGRRLVGETWEMTLPPPPSPAARA